jgi:hypothetical protein
MLKLFGERLEQAMQQSSGSKTEVLTKSLVEKESQP